jgi:DNA modification methylase
VTLYQGDCLKIMQTMAEKSVDAIITDVPYGTTACGWDVVIPFAPMWEGVKRVLKPRGVFVTTASQPFTSMLVMSNLKWFKYEWIWEKSHATGFLDVGKKPMKQHENILIFYDLQPTYNPQIYKKHELKIRNGKPIRVNTDSYGSFKNDTSRSIPEDEGYPLTIQYFASPYKGGESGEHPTQKPVSLYEYLIRTYTNEGDTVLDICMGSGTTGVACHKTRRSFIGIELKPEYFEIAQKRIAEAQMQEPLFSEAMV